MVGRRGHSAAPPRSGAIPLAISVLAFARSTAFTRIKPIAGADMQEGSARSADSLEGQRCCITALGPVHRSAIGCVAAREVRENAAAAASFSICSNRSRFTILIPFLLHIITKDALL
jgi:hypothetical protein